MYAIEVTGCVHECSVAQSCPILCDRIDYSPPDFSVHGIILARILEWVAISSSRESSRPKDWLHVSYSSCIGRSILYLWATWEAQVTGHGRAKDWTEVTLEQSYRGYGRVPQVYKGEKAIYSSECKLRCTKALKMKQYLDWQNVHRKFFIFVYIV